MNSNILPQDDLRRQILHHLGYGREKVEQLITELNTPVTIAIEEPNTHVDEIQPVMHAPDCTLTMDEVRMLQEKYGKANKRSTSRSKSSRSKDTPDGVVTKVFFDNSPDSLRNIKHMLHQPELGQ